MPCSSLSAWHGVIPTLKKYKSGDDDFDVADDNPVTLKTLVTLKYQVNIWQGILCFMSRKCSLTWLAAVLEMVSR